MKSDLEYAELSAHYDHELPSAQAAAVEEMLGSDAAAREVLGSMERVSTLVALSLDDVELRCSVLEAIDALPPGRPRRSAWLPLGLAAALLLVLGASGWWMARDPEPESPLVANAPGHAAEAEIPIVLGQVEDTSAVPVETPGTRASASDRDTPEVEATPAGVPFKLLAVDTQAAPAQAYFEQSESTSVFAVGVGGTLPDGSVVLDILQTGVLVRTPQGAEQTIDPAPLPIGLAGLWRAETTLDGDTTLIPTLEIRESRSGSFTMPVPEFDIELQGRRNGMQMKIDMNQRATLPENVIGIHLEGSLDAAWEHFLLEGSVTLVGQGDDGAVEFDAPTRIAAERLTPLEMAKARVAIARAQDHQAIGGLIKKMLVDSATRMHRLPANPGELLDAAAATSAALRGLFDIAPYHYTPRHGPLDIEAPEPFDWQGDPARLAEYERRMVSRHGMDAPMPTTILTMELEQDNVQLVFTLDTLTSDIERAIQFTEQVDAPATSPEAWADVRASSMNNLKQHGLIMMMFANEHDGYTPPGWWSTYPDFMTDTRILTYPLDPPGTVSYEYAAPLMQLNPWARETAEQQGDPSLMVELLAGLPIVYERQPHEPTPGRSVLFADGHVQWFPEAEFQRLRQEWGLR